MKTVLLAAILLGAYLAAAEEEENEVLHTLEVTMTAYSSSEDETSGDPLITATGIEVREGIVAASRDLIESQLPYGTRVRIAEIQDDPENCGGYDPGTVLEVQDTMAEWVTNRVDIWLPTRSEAQAWGLCIVILEVVGYPD